MQMRTKHLFTVPTTVLLTAMFFASTIQLWGAEGVKAPFPNFSTAVAFDVSPAVVNIAPKGRLSAFVSSVEEIRPERGPVAVDKGYSGDAAIQSGSAVPAGPALIPSPLL